MLVFYPLLDFENALNFANEYYEMIQNEIILAKHAVEYVKKISNSTSCDNCNSYKRKETAQLLNVTVDALRNWEMNNGFIKIKHSENGYRYYTETDIRRLKIIPYPCFRKLKADSFIQKKTLLSENCCSFSTYSLLCAFPQDFRHACFRSACRRNIHADIDDCFRHNADSACSYNA